MGLTKQYLRYVASAVFGVIGSQKGNIVFVTLRGEKGRYVAVPACEHVFIWDLRKGEKILILQGLKQEVTCLCPSPDGLHLAVGYEDGSIRIFSLLSGEGNVTFNGHKAAITTLKYDQLGGRLASGSKDTDIIVWDVINESGLYRLKGHKDAITQALFLREKNLLVTSGKDTMVKWWDLDTQHCFKTMVGHRTEIEDPEEPDPKKIKGSSPGIQDTLEAEDGAFETDEAPEDRILSCRKAGSIMREGRDRVVNLGVDKTGRILACHGTDSVLELFCILSKKEIQKKMDKKMKKARKKAKLHSCKGEEEDPEVNVEMSLQDEIQRVTNIKTSAKIKSFDLIHSPQGELKAVFLLQNNLVELYSLNPSLPTPQPVRTSRITIGGHRSDVRTLSFSSDNIAVLSAAADSVKIWNRSTLQCIRTMTCEYALCSFFVPGDRQVVIGTKRGFVTGGADKSVKFWDFELVKDENSTQKRLSVKQTRTLQLDEDVLCVSYSPNQKLLAVSLLDCTVKIFYVDTLKFFLSLYGHKLPVICMDISHDGALIATGSADRNVKIWGLDFGDCHKSLFAHDDSVMDLQFVPKSHLFFTAGKDHKIKQWDADKFEHIQTLEGHHQEIWCLAVSPSGDYVVSSSHDKSLRLWERTREPLILEEEREMEREAEYEESVAKEDQPAVPGETQGDSYFTGKKTIETVKAPSAYVLEIFKGIKSSELEESLLVLPFSYVPDILKLFNEFIQLGSDVELICRCLFFLLRIHFGQITSNQMLVPVIEKLRETTISKVSQVRDVIGFNMAGLDYLKRECEAKSEVMFFADATSHLEEKKRKRKKREKLILTLT
ncbi:WDR3 isoform 5 [Pan troglodytes]|uniref:WDR3 isoform 5 n=1 Tax=Pan troglodytes TaxID=9598 RepID=A0A2J8JUI2_PANTR|nr:WDR3 isoform 5 [Pan troglodytes]